MTSLLDPYFTPRHIADRLIAHVTQVEPNTVLDPAAGDGALLETAERRWRNAKISALDCDPDRLRQLRTHDLWGRGRCDFLSPSSRRASPILRSLRGGIDLVVLNPPYTGRGNARWSSNLEGVVVTSGRAMAFVLTALDIIRDGGEMVALLPSSAITSQRDLAAWELLRKVATASVVDRFPRGTFHQGTATTVGVHILKVASSAAGPSITPSPVDGQVSVELVRGVVQVHEANSMGLVMGAKDRHQVPYIHTTDMRQGALKRLRSLPAALQSARYLGPSVLVPRVGKPMSSKLALWSGGDVILSDCLFALETRSLDGAREILELMRREFAVVAAAYAGSCAPYLTVSSLVETLRGLGVAARWSGPARWAAPSAKGVMPYEIAGARA